MAGVLEGLILISVPGCPGTLPPGVPVVGLAIAGTRFTRTLRELADPPHRAADRHDMAIDAGLRALGIQATGHADEFAAIGLGRHRWTGDWVTG